MKIKKIRFSEIEKWTRFWFNGVEYVKVTSKQASPVGLLEVRQDFFKWKAVKQHVMQNL